MTASPQPTSPSVDAETLEALALSFVSIISDGQAHEASSKTIASMIINELLMRRTLTLSAPRVEPVDRLAAAEFVRRLRQYNAAHLAYELSHEVAVDALLALYTAQPSQPDTGVRAAISELIQLAAECHRTKWQFDFNDEKRLSVGMARDMVKRAFDELHRIGDLALKAKSALAAHPAPPDTVREAAYEIIGQIEARFPNWKSYHDLVDWIDCTLHALRGGR